MRYLLDKSFARRLRLNSSIFRNPYWVLPVDDKGRENYEPVGRGVRSSVSCAKWVGLDICRNFEGHKGRTLNGEDCTDKVVNRNRHFWCHKPSCPVCFIRGWSIRGARSITGRLDKAVELGLGKIEHIVVSPAVADRNLPEYVMRKKCREALVDCSVVGGVMIFHGFRINKERRVLVWSPHFHVLGFVLGGFARCRRCKGADCYECDGGFMGKAYKLYRENGYIVDVKDERECIFGSAWYQLHHATIRLGVKRFHTFTWFGGCGNRKFSSEKVFCKSLCAVCSEEMTRAVYVGNEPFVKDVGHPDYKAVFLRDEFDENGEPNYIDKDGG